jgi:hypothetical protein
MYFSIIPTVVLFFFLYLYKQSCTQYVKERKLISEQEETIKNVQKNLEESNNLNIQLIKHRQSLEESNKEKDALISQLTKQKKELADIITRKTLVIENSIEELIKRRKFCDALKKKTDHLTALNDKISCMISYGLVQGHKSDIESFKNFEEHFKKLAGIVDIHEKMTTRKRSSSNNNNMHQIHGYQLQGNVKLGRININESHSWRSNVPFNVKQIQ